GGHGDLDLRLVVVILAVAELEQAPLGEGLDVGVGGAHIHAKEVRLEAVNPDGVLVDLALAVLPGTVPSQTVEDVGQAVILEVERANGFAQAGPQGVPVGFGPGLKAAEAVVPLGGEEGEPDASNLSEGQLALPAVSGGKVAIEDLVHLQALQQGQQNGDVVHPFHALDVRGFSVHPLFGMPRPVSENPSFLSRTAGILMEDDAAGRHLGDPALGGGAAVPGHLGEPQVAVGAADNGPGAPVGGRELVDVAVGSDAADLAAAVTGDDVIFA